MPVEVVERLESRELITGNSPGATLRYWVRGTMDEIAVQTNLKAIAPTLFDLNGDGSYYVRRVGVRCNCIGDNLWDGVASYAAFNEPEFSFDTSGGQQHIVSSKSSRGFAAPGFNLPANLQAIGAREDGSVDGIDIQVPAFQFAETHFFYNSGITSQYKRTLMLATACTNHAPFKGWSAGEVLFLGAQGSRRGAGDWGINFRFAASPNLTNQTIAGIIEGVNKDGWEYLEVVYVGQADSLAKRLVSKPAGVIVHRVLDSFDFSTLGIGT